MANVWKQNFGRKVQLNIPSAVNREIVNAYVMEFSLEYYRDPKTKQRLTWQLSSVCLIIF